jgi:ribosomal subunit interface protein
VEIAISSRHAVLTPVLVEVTERKVQRLGRLDPSLARAEVHFFEEHNPRIAESEWCEVALDGGGHHVRCKASAHDAQVAVDRAVSKAVRQLHRLKTKRLAEQHAPS